jgi:integrase
MFLRFFGPQCKPASLNRRDWDRFIMERLAGRIRPAVQQREGKVKARIVEYDLRFLLGVLNWATVSRDHAGNLLLNANPLKGLKVPKEEAPNRPIVSEEQYRSLVETAAGMDWRFRLLLILVNETGHRVGAVRVLRWSDVDLSKGSIRWRAENDKIGYEHTTPLTEAAISALEEARRQLPGIGDAWVFPSPSDAGEPCSRHLVRDWWERAEDRLDWPTVKGRGWHSLRRKFATEMDGADLKALCQLGGWKDPVTILKCYKQPDQAQLKEALSQRKRLVGGAEA